MLFLTALDHHHRRLTFGLLYTHDETDTSNGTEIDTFVRMAIDEPRQCALVFRLPAIERLSAMSAI